MIAMADRSTYFLTTHSKFVGAIHDNKTTNWFFHIIAHTSCCFLQLITFWRELGHHSGHVLFNRKPKMSPMMPTRTTYMNGTPPWLLLASRLKSSCTWKIPNQSKKFNENYEMKIIAYDVFIEFFIKHLTITTTVRLHYKYSNGKWSRDAFVLKLSRISSELLNVIGDARTELKPRLVLSPNT